MNYKFHVQSLLLQQMEKTQQLWHTEEEQPVVLVPQLRHRLHPFGQHHLSLTHLERRKKDNGAGRRGRGRKVQEETLIGSCHALALRHIHHTNTPSCQPSLGWQHTSETCSCIQYTVGDPAPSDAQKDLVACVLPVRNRKIHIRALSLKSIMQKHINHHPTHAYTNLIDMQKVFNLVPTLLLCIQKAQFANKIIYLLTVPILHIHDHFRNLVIGGLGGRESQRGLMGEGWTVLQYELCPNATGV